MREVAIVLASSEFIAAFFLKLKIHKAEMFNFVTYFVYVMLLCEKIEVDHSLKNLILRISKKQNL